MDVTSASAEIRSLCPDAVVLNADARDKNDVFDLAVTELQRVQHVDPARALRALWRREQAGSTAIGRGIAIPHARVTGLAAPVSVLIRTRSPIPFEAPDHRPVYLALVILVPEDGDPEAHLQLLAEVVTLLGDRAFRDRLTSASDVRSVLRAFVERSPS
ncbi:MAG TPA: PTS sugar transporter subunit IIA [Casimicrobiaceae bacterium]|nr:PTS sugar transporter subunit IIA [Casimicrobiaceae bacterium]